MSYQQINTDFDQYFDYDHQDISSLSAQSSEIKVAPSLSHQNTDFSTSSYQNSGPTYRYGEHRQTTGMPMGGYASMLAVNQQAGFFRPHNSQFVIPNEITSLPLSNLNDYDFGYSYPNDMDLNADGQAEVSSMFPSASDADNLSPVVAVAQPQRIYPGIHTKQAAQKIQQASQRAVQGASAPALAGQRPLPTTLPTPIKTEDFLAQIPQTSDAITRLLADMRSKPVNSIEAKCEEEDNDDDSQSQKKDEEDMDEDEKLLNSEEGKKLTPKERRQLRNKVSARAFRSRRKEYIGQLEEQLQSSHNRKNELEIENAQLKEENNRLSDLTRMLLSSPSFSGFLRELSVAGDRVGAAQNAKLHQSVSRPQPQSQTQHQQVAPKDVPNYASTPKTHQSQNQNTTVGMTLIPDMSPNMSMYDPSTQWNNNIQIYSVTELPELPKIDFTKLQGKPSSTVTTWAPRSKDVPYLPSVSSDFKTMTPRQFFKTSGCESEPAVSTTFPCELATIASNTVIIHASSGAEYGDENAKQSLEDMCTPLDELCNRISGMLP